MVADPIHARRPALPGIRRRLLAALLCAPLLIVPALATTVPADAAGSVGSIPAAVDDDSVTLSVAPSSSSALHLDQPLQLSVTITNDSATALSGAVDVFLAERALTSRSALDDWLHPDDDETSGELMTSVPLTGAVQPHSTTTIGVTVPAENLGLFEWSPWGPRGIAASLSTADDEVLASAQSAFVWYPDTASTPITPITPVNLAVAMPITTPANSTGLITAEDLAAYTAPSGILSRQLDGALNQPVAIAIDPMIIASIRVLGTNAPTTALDWLNRLSQAQNDIFPLGYADADPALAIQAGAATPLAPTSLAFATDPNLFPTSQETAPSAPQDGSTEGDIPSPASTEPVAPGDGTAVPTLDQLLAWDYTTATIAWPAEDTVALSDVAAFATGGLTTTILADGNVSSDSGDSSHGTTIQLGENGLGLVADHAISAALRTAVTATTDEAWRAAMAEVSAEIAVVAAENPTEALTLLATMDRGWPATAARLSQTIEALSGLPWYSPATLTDALATPVSTDVALKDQAEPTEAVDLASRLIQREAELISFSSTLSDPDAVLGPNRLALLALLATSWRTEPTPWRTAVGDNLTASDSVLHGVTVSTKGPINVVGSKVDIPVTLSNTLSQAVTVRVQVVPSNGRLVVGNDVDAVIDASSAKSVSVPVTAAVGNGAVTLKVTLYSPAGAAIDEPSLIPVNVRADWEGIGSRIFAALVVLFFGFGVWRNIVHKRHNRALAAQSDADPDADLESGADAPPMAPEDTIPATPTTPPTPTPAPLNPDDHPAAPRG